MSIAIFEPAISGVGGISPTLLSKASTVLTTDGATPKMMGFAALFTPTKTGQILVIAHVSTGFSKANPPSTGSANNGTKIDLRFGTGAAPANGDAVSGTFDSTRLDNILMTAATVEDLETVQPIFALRTGLTIGTQLWFDCAGTGAVAGFVIASTLTLIIIEF